jgi:hypothetical protein
MYQRYRRGVPVRRSWRETSHIQLLGRLKRKDSGLFYFWSFDGHPLELELHSSSQASEPYVTLVEAAAITFLLIVALLTLIPDKDRRPR